MSSPALEVFNPIKSHSKVLGLRLQHRNLGGRHKSNHNSELPQTKSSHGVGEMLLCFPQKIKISLSSMNFLWHPWVPQLTVLEPQGRPVYCL